jgi:hypothetical protein
MLTNAEPKPPVGPSNSQEGSTRGKFKKNKVPIGIIVVANIRVGVQELRGRRPKHLIIQIQGVIL